MKKIFTIFCICIALTAAAQRNVAPAGESLNYKVMYKWGLIDKQAGHARLKTSNTANGSFKAELTAASEKWADRFYKVRDTLRGTISHERCEPSFYEKIAYEGGSFKHDRLTYSRSGDTVKASCVQKKQKKASKPFETIERTLTAQGTTLDMLSAYYYMRSLDYDMMSPGTVTVLNVFSGKQKEILTIKYRGIADIELDGKKYPTYHIQFTFTGKGGKKTSDDMDAWISTAADRIPLKLEGKLPVGKVQCFFTGKD